MLVFADYEANISQEKFRELLSLCFSYGDMFSLTGNRWYPGNEVSKEVLDRLSPYLVEKLFVTDWFAHHVPKENSLEVHLFWAVPEARSILMEYYESLFIDDTAWYIPEDLCFFKEKQLFLGSISHEMICHVYDRGDGILERIYPLGHWKEVDDEQEEQEICRAVLEKIFEKNRSSFHE